MSVITVNQTCAESVALGLLMFLKFGRFSRSLLICDIKVSHAPLFLLSMVKCQHSHHMCEKTHKDEKAGRWAGHSQH